jgi:hypothetical protein
MSARAKPLIAKGSEAVAEGRQGRFHRHFRTTAIPATPLARLRRVAPVQGLLADDHAGAEPDQMLFRPVGKAGETLEKRAFDFAYCRPFSTLHRLADLSYTQARIVIALTVYTGLRRQTYGFLAARQEDSRY